MAQTVQQSWAASSLRAAYGDSQAAAEYGVLLLEAVSGALAIPVCAAVDSSADPSKEADGELAILSAPDALEGDRRTSSSSARTAKTLRQDHLTYRDADFALQSLACRQHLLSPGRMFVFPLHAVIRERK